MKGSALLETMARSVEAQCQERLNAARAEANAIVSDAQKRAAEQREQALAATRHEMEVLDERWRQKADAEAIKASLAMKKAAVNAVLDHVDQRVKEIVEGPEFTAVLDALLAELMQAAEGEVLVLAPEKHVDHVKQWLSANGHGDMAVEGSRETLDGVALQDSKRTFRISNTLSGRYAKVEQEIRRVCMTGLFGESPAEPAG